MRHNPKTLTAYGSWSSALEVPDFIPQEETGTKPQWVQNEEDQIGLLKPCRFSKTGEPNTESIREVITSVIGQWIEAAVPKTRLIPTEEGIPGQQCISYLIGKTAQSAEEAVQSNSAQKKIPQFGKNVALGIFLGIADRMNATNYLYHDGKLYDFDFSGSFNSADSREIGPKEQGYGALYAPWSEQIYPPAIIEAIRQNPRPFQDGVKNIRDIRDEELDNMFSILWREAEYVTFEELKEMREFVKYRRDNINALVEQWSTRPEVRLKNVLRGEIEPAQHTQDVYESFIPAWFSEIYVEKARERDVGMNYLWEQKNTRSFSNTFPKCGRGGNDSNAVSYQEIKTVIIPQDLFQYFAPQLEKRIKNTLPANIYGQCMGYMIRQNAEHRFFEAVVPPYNHNLTNTQVFEDFSFASIRRKMTKVDQFHQLLKTISEKSLPEKDRTAAYLQLTHAMQTSEGEDILGKLKKYYEKSQDPKNASKLGIFPELKEALIIPNHVTFFWFTGWEEQGLPRRNVVPYLDLIAEGIALSPNTKWSFVTDDVHLVRKTIDALMKGEKQKDKPLREYLAESSGYHEDDAAIKYFLEDFEKFSGKKLFSPKGGQKNTEQRSVDFSYLGKLRLEHWRDLLEKDKICIRKNDPEFKSDEYFSKQFEIYKKKGRGEFSGDQFLLFVEKRENDLVVSDSNENELDVFTMNEKSGFLKLARERLELQDWRTHSSFKDNFLRNLKAEISCESSGSSPLRCPQTSADIMKIVALKVRPGFVFDVKTKFKAPVPDNLPASKGIRAAMLPASNKPDVSHYTLENGAMAAPRNSLIVEEMLRGYEDFFSGKTKHEFAKCELINKMNNWGIPPQASERERNLWFIKTLKRLPAGFGRSTFVDALSIGLLCRTLNKHLGIKDDGQESEQAFSDRQESSYASSIEGESLQSESTSSSRSNSTLSDMSEMWSSYSSYPSEVLLPNDFFELAPTDQIWRKAPMHPKAVAKRSSAPQLTAKNDLTR